jgi:hypothetical protein
LGRFDAVMVIKEPCLRNVSWYLSQRNNLSADSNFEAGIAKIQGGSEQMMTQAAKGVCKPFRKEENSKCSDDDPDSDKEDFFLKEFEKSKNKKQRRPAVRVTILTVISSQEVQLLLRAFVVHLMHLMPRYAVVCLQSQSK